jgi:hypothetical protein
MADAYVKAALIGGYEIDFTDWHWGDFDADIYKNANEAAARLMAAEIFGGMSLHLDASRGLMGSAVVVTDAIDDAVYSFDLADAVFGAVEDIATNYHPNFRAERRAETLADLRAFRAKMVLLVEAVDAQINDQDAGGAS